MKTIWRKAISYMLTACMLLGMIPVQAQAAGAGDTMYATTAEELEEGFSNMGIRRIVWNGTEPIVADERITVNKETYDRGKVTLELKTDLNIQYSGDAYVYLAFKSIDLSIVSATNYGDRATLSLKENADSTCEYGTRFLFTTYNQSVTLQSVYVDADTTYGDGIYAFTANDNIDLTLNGSVYFKPKYTTVRADSLSLHLGAGSFCNCTDLKSLENNCTVKIDYQDGAIISLTNTNSMEYVRSCVVADEDVVLVPTEENSVYYQIMTVESITQGALGTQSNPYVLSGTVLSARDAAIINKDYERAFYAQIPKLAAGETFNLNGRSITSPNLILDLNGQTVQTDNSSEDKIPDFARMSGNDNFYGGRENFDNMIDHTGRGTWDRAKKDSNFMNHMHDYSINSAAKDSKWYYFQQYCKWEVHVGDNEGALRAVEIEDGAKLTIMDSSSAQTGCVKTDAIPWYESYDEKNEEESQLSTTGKVIGAILTMGILNIVDAAGGLGDDVHKLYVQHPENEMFHIHQGGELIVDGGTFEFVPKKSGYSEKNETKPTMFMVDGGKLTINGGEFTAEGIEDHTQVFPRVIEMPITQENADAGTALTINDGTFWNGNRGHAVLLHTDVDETTIIKWLQDPTTAPVQIKAGTFRGASGAIVQYSQYEPGIYEPDLGYTVNKGEYTDSYKVNLLSGGDATTNLMSGSTATGDTTKTVITSTDPYVPQPNAEDAEIHSLTLSANGTTGTEITYADFDAHNGITATVDATSPDGGKLLYGWYVNGQFIKTTESNTLLIEDDVNKNIFWYTNYRGDRVRNFFDDGMLLSAVSVRCCVSNYHDGVVSDTVISDVCNLIRTTKPLPDRSKITLTALDDDAMLLEGLDDDYIFIEPSYQYLFEGETSEDIYGLKDGDAITFFNQAQAWEKYTVDSEPITIYVQQENPPEVITRGTPGENQVIAEPTTTGSDGQLLGVTSEMEWRKKGETEWTTGNSYGYAIGNLVAGTYEVRNKGTDKLYSEPAEVEVGMMMGSAVVELEIKFRMPDDSEYTLYLLDNGTASWLNNSRPNGVGWANAPTFDAFTGTLDLNDMTLGTEINPIMMMMPIKAKNLLIEQDTTVHGQISITGNLTILGDSTLTITHGYNGLNGDGLSINGNLTIEDTTVVVNGLKGYDYGLTGIDASNITLKGNANVTIQEPSTNGDNTSIGIRCFALYLLEKSALTSTVGTAEDPVQTGSYALKTNDMFMVGNGPYEFRAWVYEAGRIIPYCAITTDETIAIRQAYSYREMTKSDSFTDVTTKEPFGYQYNGFMRMGSTKNVDSIEITLHEGELGNSIAEIPEGSVVNPEKTGNKPFHVTADVFGDIGVSQGVIWSWESDDVPEDEVSHLLYSIQPGADGSLLLWKLQANKTYTIVATSMEDPDVQGRFTFTVGDVMEKLEGTVTMVLEEGKTVPREGDVITVDTSSITNDTGQYTYTWSYTKNGEWGEHVWVDTVTPQLTITSDMVGTEVNLGVVVRDRERSGAASSTNQYNDIGSYVPGEPQVTGVRVSPSRVNVNPGGSIQLSAWQLGLDLSDTPEFTWEVEFNKNGTYVELTSVDDTKGCTVAIKDNAPIGTEIRVVVRSEGKAVVSTVVVVDKETNNLTGVRQDDITYGEPIAPEAVLADGATEPNGGTITYGYKSSAASYSEPFTSTKPAVQGTYLVQATSSASGNVDGASVQSSFTISGKEPAESVIVKSVNLKASTTGVQRIDLTDYIPADASGVAIKTTAYEPTKNNPEIAAMFKNPNVLRDETANEATFELEGAEAGDVGQVITTITSDNYATIMVLIEVTIVEKNPQNLSFEASQYTKTTADSGQSFTNTLTGAQTAVTYAVSGDTGALTVDNSGKVTLTGVAGVAVVTATAEENATYAKATATYIVQVTSDGDTYQVTVENGTGSGAYTVGATVTISAAPPSGKALDTWAVQSGDITLGSTTAATTTFKMPDSAVAVKANLKEGSAGLLGDVNGDGKVNISDVIRLLNHVNKSQLLADESVGRINSDGVVNISDVIRLLNHVNKSDPLW